MKKHALRLLLTIAIALSSLSAYADRDDKDKDDHKKVDATEMGLIGLAAGSVLGAGAYWILRRRVRSRS